MERLPPTLVDLLSNSIILRQTAPYLPVQALLRLGSTSKTVRELINGNPDAWRHLDLTKTKQVIMDSSPIDVGGVNWRSQRMDEALCEDDFYAGPLRGIFGRLRARNVLQNVHTLILDGTSVVADVVHEIVNESNRYNVRVLSIREAKNLNQSRLQQALRYAVRPTRADNTPKLKALYFFGPKDAPRILENASQRVPPPPLLGIMSSQGAQIGAEWNQRSSTALNSCLSDEQTKWYSNTGRALKRPLSDWPETLRACKGVICFDAVLCRGPRHDITKVDSKEFLQPTIATIALGPGGCENCHSCPEGRAVFGQSEDSALPLLGPPPSHSSTLRAALRPEAQADGTFPRLILRCEACLKGRWCEQCNRWWCEDCFEESNPSSVTNQQRPSDQGGQVPYHPLAVSTPGRGGNLKSVKVFSGLCVDQCLIEAAMSGAGSNGMWG